MRRRQFNQTLLGALALPGMVRGQPSPERSFAQALTQKPWLLGYRSVAQEAFDGVAKLSGHWPDELRGTLYRNGPARHDVHGFRYRHWFDGDGMVQAFRIGDDGVSHRGRLVQTNKLQAEDQAGRALFPTFGSRPPNAAPITEPDTANPANISILYHHDTLMALWEAGSPWVLNPDSLDTLGMREFSKISRGVPFSAHPRVEPDGTLWNFGYFSSASLLVLWHLDARGRVVKLGKIEASPISMPHDFIVTRKHIVLLIPPLYYQHQPADNFLDAHRWMPNEATRVLVVDKEDFDTHYWLELPAQWVFHFGNGWEDESGVIRFDGARAPDPDVMLTTFRKVMRGEIRHASASEPHQYRIDTRKRSIAEAPLLGSGQSADFPVIDPRVSCRQNRSLVMLTGDTRQPSPHLGFNQVTRLNLAGQQLDSFRYPDHQIPEEHIVVPRQGSSPESAGWVLGTALDWRAQQTILNLFDLRRLNDGPLASASLPYALPLGLHGKFVAS